MFDEPNKGFWLVLRQAFLLMVDAVEKGLKISPTTSEIRQMYKEGRLNKG